MIKKPGLILAAVLLLAACSTVRTREVPNANLSSYQHIYVIHLLSDGNGTDQIIARELRKMGYDATCGPLTLMPPETQIVIRYQDEWTFDFTNYMIQLNMDVGAARTDKLLATGTRHRPSITGGSTVDMVDALLKGFFKPKSPPVPDPT